MNDKKLIGCLVYSTVKMLRLVGYCQSRDYFVTIQISDRYFAHKYNLPRSDYLDIPFQMRDKFET